ncbi:MAG: N-acetyl-gamma-glutamyl-phosphate reductase [Armatimonadetes bacterium]|nr:N-acetyl-gamma-glutamyl-phosphate reductase [Armatimonadota bacterium]
MPKTKLAIFGAAGYGGVEMLRFLRGHPMVEVTFLAAHTNAGKPLSEAFPHLLGFEDRVLEESDVDRALDAADVMVFALPHAAGMPLVARARAAGRKVLDFSADFRLKDVAIYEKHYGPHSAPELLAEAVYGLPEIHRGELATADLIAVPGCYPTGAILALLPAVRTGIVAPQSIIVDSKSGVSGAGRSKLTLTTHFCEVSESVSAYNVASHRHNPEIDQELSLWGSKVHVTFSPHLIPMNRGILTTAYADLERPLSVREVHQIYAEAYRDEPFVRLLPPGQYPATKYALGTNYCFIGLTVDEEAGRLIVISAIDNLGKGLAGAAVQCLNVAQGWPETLGLEDFALWP